MSRLFPCKEYEMWRLERARRLLYTLPPAALVGGDECSASILEFCYPKSLGNWSEVTNVFFFLTGWKLKPVTIANKFKPPQPIEWIDEWLVIFEQVHSTMTFPVENIANIKQPIRLRDGKDETHCKKQFSFSFFRVGIFDDVSGFCL